MSHDDDDDDEPEQLSLDDVMSGALVRGDDPYTSHEAAKSQTEEKVNRVRARVLLSMLDQEPMTDDALIAKVVHQFGEGSPSSIRTRRAELVRFGWITQAGEGVSRFGRASILWQMTGPGETYVRGHFGALIERAHHRKAS